MKSVLVHCVLVVLLLSPLFAEAVRFTHGRYRNVLISSDLSKPSRWSFKSRFEWEIQTARPPAVDRYIRFWICSYWAAHASSRTTLPPAQWFTQVLDHFTPSDVRTWQQRFFVNDTFYKPGGPIFIYIGGEGPLAAHVVVDLQIAVYAQQFSTLKWFNILTFIDALILALEHRFYGQSAPLPDLSVESLQYLNAQQALADLAYFRNAMNQKYGTDTTKWICFGGSYPGSLSAWFRIKYPHVCDSGIGK